MMKNLFRSGFYDSAQAEILPSHAFIGWLILCLSLSFYVFSVKFKPNIDSSCRAKNSGFGVS